VPTIRSWRTGPGAQPRPKAGRPEPAGLYIDRVAPLGQVGGVPRSAIRQIAVGTVLALVGCTGSVALDRALEDGRKRYQSRDWEGAVDRTEAGLRDAGHEASDSQRADAYVLIGRAHRREGHMAAAFADLLTANRLWPYAAAPGEFEEVRRSFLESVSGAAVSRAHLRYGDHLPSWYRMVALEYWLDERSIFSWRWSTNAQSPTVPDPLVDLPMSATDHYVRIDVSYRLQGKAAKTYGDALFRVRGGGVFPCHDSRTTKVRVSVVNRFPKREPFGSGLDIDYAYEED
jgi:hypothetical protein